MRYQRGWTQEIFVARMQFRGLLKMTRDILANLECMRSVAHDIHVLYIADALGVSCQDLFPEIVQINGKVFHPRQSRKKKR